MIVDLIIKNGTCVTHEKTFKADIAVKKGKIVQIGDVDKFKAKQTINAKGMHILPGAFDSQCHFREPGVGKPLSLTGVCLQLRLQHWSCWHCCC